MKPDSYLADDIIYYYAPDLLTLNMTAHVLNQPYADAPEVLHRQVALTKQEAILLHSLLSAYPGMCTRAEIAEAMHLPHRTPLQLERSRAHFIPIMTTLNTKLAPVGLDIAAVLEEGYVLMHRVEE